MYDQSTPTVAKKIPKASSTGKSDYVTVKIRAHLHQKAKRIAAHRGEDIAVVLSDLLEAPLGRAYEKYRAEVAAEGQEGTGDPAPN